MGTRADFYVGRGGEAAWLGSIAWDGHPAGINESVLRAETEEKFRSAVEEFLTGRDDATRPEQGWPWPWEDSRTTDYAYAFEGDTVHAACFGHGWWVATEDEPEDYDALPKQVFPDMTDRQNVTLGKRSGVFVIEGKRGGGEPTRET